MLYFTKDELHIEISNYMCAFADCLESVYFAGAGWGLLGLNSKDYPKQNICDLKPEDVDIYKFRITSRLDELYEYGVNGRRGVYFNWTTDDEDEDFFLKGLDDFPLLYENTIESISIAFSKHAVRMASARWFLDEGHEGSGLALSEVALLANMDEKSVRNAANPKRENHLATYSNGARTFVKLEDARAWLKQRRGFKPTVMVDERDLAKRGFFSEQDFGIYLTTQREKKGLTLAAAVNAIVDDELTEEKLRDLEHSKFFFDQALFIALAQLYELDVKAFLLAGLALHQKLERERIEEQINKHIHI